MTSEIDKFRTSLVAAVQAELERHAAAVVAEVDRLRQEGRHEREQMRKDFDSRMAELSQQIERSQAQAEQARAESDRRAEAMKAQLESRLTDAEQRQTRRLDEVTGSMEGLIAEAARPMLTDIRDENAEVVRRVEGLDANLRKFDEQAARMVTYFNDVTEQMERRQDELAKQLESDVGVKVEELKRLVDENDSAVRKFQNDVGHQVTSKLNDAEDRFNNRLLAAEERIKEDSGQRIADIDVHVGRVSANLDESLEVINDRIMGLDDRFVEYGRQIRAIEESVEGVDKEALEQLKDKMSSAAGEAMLVRIEMERFQKTVDERTDTLAVRLTEAETAIQDATLDVSTAVQLDRLEEIERALGELDPTQFVRRDGNDPTVTPPGDGAAYPPDGESVEYGSASADGSSGPDIGAIIAAAEGRTLDDLRGQD